MKASLYFLYKMRKAKIIKGYLWHVLCDDEEVYVHSICSENGKVIVEIPDGRLFSVDVEDIQFKDPPEPERGIVLQAYSICPVCHGTGKVTPGFYASGTIGQNSDWSSMCRTCHGRGVLKN